MAEPEFEDLGPAPKQDAGMVDASGMVDTVGAAVGDFFGVGREGSGARDIAGGIADAFSGEKTTEFPDASELGTFGPDVSQFSTERLKMALAYATVLDEEGIANIAIETLQGKSKQPMTKKQDKHGNWMVSFSGKDYYINKPGMSEADLFQILGQAAVYAPASRLTAGAGGIIKRMLVGGILAPATSMATDIVGQAQGSDKEISSLRAAFALGGGILFEGLSPLAGKAMRRVGKAFSKRMHLYVKPTGELTRRGRKAARARGVDVDDLQDRMYAKMRERTTGSTAHAREDALEDTAEFGIEYTKGQASGDFDQLAFEEGQRASRSAEGGNIIREFDAGQQAQREAAEEALQGRVAGRMATIETTREGGEQIAEAAGRGRAALATAAGEAYDTADAAVARYEGGHMKRFWRRLRNDPELDMKAIDDLSPASRKAIKDLTGLSREVSKRQKSDKLSVLDRMQKEVDDYGKATPETARMARVQFKEFSRIRKKLGNRIGAAVPGSPDKRMATIIKSHYDDYLEDAFEQGLFSGDPQALSAMKEANVLWKDLKTRYGDPNSKEFVSKVVGKMTQREATGTEVVNWMFGRTSLDGAPDAAVRVAAHLKENVLGHDEWSTLVETAWLKMTRNPATGQMLTPQRLASTIDKTLSKQHDLMKVMFGEEGMGIVQRYRRAVGRLILPARAGNPSGTAGAIRRYMGDLEQTIRTYLRGAGQLAKISGDPVGGTSMFLASKVPLFRSGVAKQARDAVREGSRPRMPLSPAATAIGQGAMQTMEE